MNELHLFAGAGGGILGGILLGHTCVCAVEIEPYCRKVLFQRQRDGILPKFPIWDDVRTFDGIPWRGKVDVVCGGFPCQDISSAGKGAGITGERSGLWSEMARIIGEVRPRYALVENSPMLTIRGLGVVLGDLAAMGYDARWCVLGADDAGAPHIRKRIWILAYTACNIGNTWRPEPEGQFGEAEASNGSANMADAPSPQNNGERGNSECGRDAVGWNQQTAFSKNREANNNGLGGCREDVSDTNEGGWTRGGGDFGKRDWRGKPKNSDWWTVEPDVG